MPDNDLVPLFGQMMTRDWAEALSSTQAETHYRDAGGEYLRVPFGRERSLHPSVAAAGPCRHCGTIQGKLHDPSCDYEECPKCGQPTMECECEFIGHEWRAPQA